MSYNKPDGPPPSYPAPVHDAGPTTLPKRPGRLLQPRRIPSSELRSTPAAGLLRLSTTPGSTTHVLPAAARYPQPGYYADDRGGGGSSGGGICAGIMAALACCCCLDILF
ncbi:hypothetical protein AARAC_010487 [Aspergillus arachidicola]|uniref:Cysteine-rich transmembrane domain-containing protein n=1 Tax=Aspergillus arachidicola TaxID=656916 RepID=A0A2G7FEZ5_9EURO|nr:hypothetical protein AARAC_010487 [Aspergillus arachidicola]